MAGIPGIMSSRTVLIAGDESLHFYKASGKKAVHVISLSWETEDFEKRAARLLEKECGGRPVTILYDLVEQHYRKEPVPSVSVLDKKHVIDRKLMMAFPNYPAVAAMPLKEKPGIGTPSGGKASGSGVRGASQYLFAALPNSDILRKLIRTARKTHLNISGFGLLPVESSAMASQLSRAVSKGKKPSRWVVMIGQHRNGMLRQIITKNGEIALTRLTPIVDSDSDVSLWASDVAGEFKATMSYLSRFGYNPKDGLDVILISKPEAGQAAAERISEPCRFTHMTLREAGKILGISLPKEKDLRYADALHAAWTARRPALVLPVRCAELSAITLPRKAVSALGLVLFIGGVGLAGYFFHSFEQYAGRQAALTRVEKQLAAVQAEYDEEVRKKKEMGVDVELLQGSIDAYINLEKNNIQPLWTIKQIGSALGNGLTLESINIQKIERDPAPLDERSGRRGRRGGEDARPAGGYSRTAIEIKFPPETDPAKGIQEIKRLRDRIQKALPDYDVFVSRQIADLSWRADIQGTAGGAEEKNTQDYVAELVIRGPKNAD